MSDRITRTELSALSIRAAIQAQDEIDSPRGANYDQRADAYSRLANAADALDAMIARDELNNLLGSPPQKEFPDGHGEATSE